MFSYYFIKNLLKIFEIVCKYGEQLLNESLNLIATFIKYMLEYISKIVTILGSNKKVNYEEKEHQFKRLTPGELYLDNRSKKIVEFRYLSQEGRAIVCMPGDSVGGMQSLWSLEPHNLDGLERVLNETNLKSFEKIVKKENE